MPGNSLCSVKLVLQSKTPFILRGVSMGGKCTYTVFMDGRNAFHIHKDLLVQYNHFRLEIRDLLLNHCSRLNHACPWVLHFLVIPERQFNIYQRYTMINRKLLFKLTEQFRNKYLRSETEGISQWSQLHTLSIRNVFYCDQQKFFRVQQMMQVILYLFLCTANVTGTALVKRARPSSHQSQKVMCYLLRESRLAL